ncbi:phosphoribosylformylglycinamidine cyclo-ligase [Helicobacter aurati]|uniref:Phosphoribosylformylglycinamidine cyclo-ligase n=1 Tax=Helicobacter aurati TaxID=137778 RepID=A0A3D8J111_9HELI|nr:phosphoribosylformylglycinamidine cyclo-ligase [Helicobacter aurati]RDU70865.1 phosphoribosylformylglycinamidine cyclo-ligase [Helicobacter aurati]
MNTLTYKNFGVDIAEGNHFVQELKPLVQTTFNPLVLGGLGGFSGCFEIPKGYKNPILCSATDGVGSKLKLAIEHDKIDNIGIDLVAMCVNDLLCDFATPLFFLDYYATHKLVKDTALRVMKGIVAACKQSQCALIGGETAEMPSIYAQNEFDLAGFAVGIAEKMDLEKRQHIRNGDIVLAFPSNGLHSNGFSLLRGIIETKNIDIMQSTERDSTLLDSLLQPTRIYVREFLTFKDRLKALAHITGGGLKENLIRVLPCNTRAIIQESSIRVSAVFQPFLPHITKEEAFLVFNMGIGMTAITTKEEASYIITHSDAYPIGHIESGEQEVIIQ